jgi:hydrogenase maturation protease
MARTVILGIGNCLQADRGAGIHAAHRLRERVGDDAALAIIDAGMLEFPLLPALADADGLIAIEAAPAGGAPGALTVREGAEFDRHVARAAEPGHQLGLKDLVDAARTQGVLPARRVLIAIEPECVDWGLAMSTPVAAALPACIDQVLAYVERWRTHPPPRASSTARSAA